MESESEIERRVRISFSTDRKSSPSRLSANDFAIEIFFPDPAIKRKILSSEECNFPLITKINASKFLNGKEDENK